ncbi:DUF3841 domain-containing protein [Bacillus cereus group sp. BfR-BA-01379]|uniref:DUF3841 domain-containing protein n=1 Tax=Bacillus cereus group sp. BfR-BA-01379 TaxID=2920323 RepID=UPI001F56FBFE|nr:DUF3841 domain-containing protein [Bacillus cereus group sp. BfR-BA-01379]
MIVYTVKPLHIYKKMQEEGFYHGNEKYVCPHFKSPYAWMILQMKERIPNYDGRTFPVWVWNKRPDQNRPALLPKGQKGVILTLDIPDEDILWSCFHTWHAILNNSPITKTEEEWDHFETEGFPKDKMIATWTRIFDFDWLQSLDKDWIEFDPDWVQGVTPRIEMKHIMKAKRFIAK